MIALTHVGERLIAEMLTREASVRGVLGDGLGVDVSRRVARVEVSLASYGKLRFDGASRIDVALVNGEDKRLIACEAKLGATRLSRNAFERFLAPCGTSHEGARVKGSMPAILERKLPRVSGSPSLTARAAEGEYVVEERWALIVRRRTAEGWTRRGRPSLSERCAVVSFEDLVHAYGGPRAFNALVRELLEVDYFAEWLA